MKILGIHDGHNSSACFLENGDVKWLIQEERLRGEKNYDGFPTLAINTILKAEQLSPSDIDHIAMSSNYMPSPLNRMQLLDVYSSLGSIQSIVRNRLKAISYLDSKKRSSNKRKRLEDLSSYGFNSVSSSFLDHHLCHASSAYFGNGNYEDPVLILTNDGAGDRVCATVSIGHQGSIERLSQTNEANSVGILYAMVTFLMGMVPLEHEYKLMGMAPYADEVGSRRIADDLHDWFTFTTDGLSWKFNRGESVYSAYNFIKNYFSLKRFDHVMGGLQLFIEEFLLKWLQNAIQQTGVRKIALAGGTFMNVKANQKLMELPEVENIFVFPSCGDESNSYGAAAYETVRLENHLPSKLESIYWGLEWSDESILESYQRYDFCSSCCIKQYENIEEKVASLLAEGKVVARFKGREEFGARSLGNRAIMANPSDPGVVKKINKMIKSRDFWMPFASSILDRLMDDYIVFDAAKNLPHYMIMTYDTKSAAHEVIAAGLHPYDKTVRPQYVSEAHNREYWQLINHFYDKTGIGGVLNTSLNLHGLPLVHSPSDAFNVLENSGLEILAIGNFLVTKNNGR